jgi:hypothetical protein
VATERDFSDELEEWLKGDTPKTVGALSEEFEERSFAVTILLFMFPSALPIPTGGITHVLELFAIAVALQMVAGRKTLWIPRRWAQRELGASMTGKAVPFISRRIRWFEKYSEPRLAGLFNQRWFMRIVGLVVIVFTVGAIIAPPFSGLDTLPALGVVIICLAIILEDMLMLVIGSVIGAGGIALILTIGAAIAHFLRNLF